MTEDHPSRPRRPGAPIVVTALLVVALAAGGWFAWQTWFLSPGPREQLQIVSVQRGDLEDLVTATGTLQPRDYVDVGAQVSGQLKKIHVEVGSVVQQGDLLAEIDPTVLLANVDARRAGLRSLRAALGDRAATLVLAQAQAERQKNLMAEGATTTEALQQADAALRSAKAQLAAQQASIEQTESSLRADEANLNYARIFAPLTGTVVSVTARQGQTLNVNQSAPTVLRIADLSTMTVQTQVSEADVNRLRPGMPVYFTTLGGQGERWQGQLRKVEPTPVVTNNVVLYNALFDVSNVRQVLMPSMTAQVFFVAASVRDALLLPVAAVPSSPGGARRRPGGASGAAPEAAASAAAGASVPSGAGRRARLQGPAARAADRGRAAGPAGSAPGRAPRRATVRVIDANDRIEERSVELGVSNRVQVQILAGLKEGDEVVVGQRVAAAPTRPATPTSGLQQSGPGAGRGGGGPR